MPLTRKSYIELANACGALRAGLTPHPDHEIAYANFFSTLTHILSKDNPRFDYYKFLSAVNEASAPTPSPTSK